MQEREDAGRPLAHSIGVVFGYVMLSLVVWGTAFAIHTWGDHG